MLFDKKVILLLYVLVLRDNFPLPVVHFVDA